MNSYVQGLISNVTALNNFINLRVENVPANASQTERLVLLGNYISNLATNDTALQTLLNELGLNTLSDLDSYINTLAANQGEGYSTLELALLGEEISISQLRDLIQQIGVLEGGAEAILKADLDGNNVIGTPDLLLFLASYGLSTNVDYGQGYTGLILPSN